MSINILVVDDSLPMRAVIIKVIKASGFTSAQFFEASNGKQALDILRNNWLDLVLTDYNMPDMNGIKLIQEMKKDDILKTIPVIMVTTEGSQKKVEEFMEEGAFDYVKKPFTPEIIKQKIIRILGEADDKECFEECNDDLDF